MAQHVLILWFMRMNAEYKKSHGSRRHSKSKIVSLGAKGHSTLWGFGCLYISVKCKNIFTWFSQILEAAQIMGKGTTQILLIWSVYVCKVQKVKLNYCRHLAHSFANLFAIMFILVSPFCPLPFCLMPFVSDVWKL